MSLTPLDESDRRARSDDSSAERTETAPVLGGLVEQVRATAGRVAGAVSRWLGGPATGEEAGEKPGRELAVRDGGRRVHPIERAHEESEARRSTAVFRPGTDSREGTDDGIDRSPVPAESPDRPDLVARWHDDSLTLSDPDATGAHISSDTWTDVER